MQTDSVMTSLRFFWLLRKTCSMRECIQCVLRSLRKCIYTVTVRVIACTDKPCCIPQCTEQECAYLCQLMVHCSCVDYTQGYLCKHAHKALSPHMRKYYVDRVLALLIQASTSIKAAMTPTDSQTPPFEKKDHFYPTQKNETQLWFNKTTTPGRKRQKRQNLPLRHPTKEEQSADQPTST